MKNKHLIILILALQFLSVSFYAQSAPQQTKEEKKKAEQEQKAQEKQAKEQQKQQEKQAKADAKAAKDSAPVPVERIYDRFQNRTTVRFVTPTSQESVASQGVELNLGITMSFPGTSTENEKDISLLLLLTYRVSGYSHPTNRELILLVDNVPVNFGQLKVGSSSTKSYNSRVTFSDGALYKEISVDTLIGLTKAQTIEGRFSGVEFRVSPKLIPTMKLLLK
jgi:Na+-transporting methylmalonyl-CoA/oxaloacetate decarboxylase gamma subunit